MTVSFKVQLHHVNKLDSLYNYAETNCFNVTHHLPTRNLHHHNVVLVGTAHQNDQMTPMTISELQS